jgi:hypothetical protein
MGHESEKYKLNEIVNDLLSLSIYVAQDIFRNMLIKNGRVELGRNKFVECIKDKAYYQVRLGFVAD